LFLPLFVGFSDAGPRAAIAATVSGAAAVVGGAAAVVSGAVPAARPLLRLDGVPEADDEPMTDLLAGGSSESEEDGGDKCGGVGQKAQPTVQHGDDQVVAKLMHAALLAGSKKYVQDVRDGFLREKGRQCGFSNERLWQMKKRKFGAIAPNQAQGSG
jgi:hypothetical protein